MQDRIFQDIDEQWYYRARGNDKVGPFSSRLEAELRLERQIRSWNGQWSFKLRPKFANPFRASRSATRQT